jgi:cytoskeletal protein CcmA (bactofilin family)
MPRIADRVSSTFIKERTMLQTEGELKRTIDVSGEVQGDVAASAGTVLRVLENAVIHGDLRIDAGASAVIEGEVQGNVIAMGSLHIASGGVVHGDIDARG